MPESSDPYTFPGTDILRNIAEIRDWDALAAFEANATVARLAELDAAPILGRFDAAHLKAIHRHVFQDVFSWAGQFRTINISRDGHLFGAAEFLEQSLGDVFQKLAREDHLRRTTLDTFAERAAFYLGEINAAHPFREGNGRVQREFLRQLGSEAGFPIDWRRTDRQQMIEASRKSARTGETAGFVEIIRACLRR